MTDFVDAFLDYTKDLPSPQMFRQWAGITAVAGALERRVWLETTKPLFPNMFVLLVGPPGSGKTVAIDEVYDLWHSTKKLHLAPKRMSRAGMIDALVESKRNIIIGEGKGLMEFHSLQVASSEFGSLVSSYDLEFLSVLNDIYDNPRVFGEKLRWVNGGKTKDIIRPQITLLAGAQPVFLASLLPEEAWGMGTTSRLLMIYSSTSPKIDLWKQPEKREDAFARLSALMKRMVELMGRVTVSPEAMAALQGWVNSDMKPVPDHSRLKHYVSRRVLHVLKLSIIAAISRSQELVVKLEDVTRARDWLMQAELLMPDIFREMLNKSDAQVIQELHFFLWQIWIKRPEPIHETRIWHFLHNRLPSDKIYRLLETAEKAGVISRIAGSEKLYVPRPTHEHGKDL